MAYHEGGWLGSINIAVGEANEQRRRRAIARSAPGATPGLTDDSCPLIVDGLHTESRGKIRGIAYRWGCEWEPRLFDIETDAGLTLRRSLEPFEFSLDAFG